MQKQVNEFKYVSDIIGDDYKNKWKNNDCVILDVDTGLGKTTFCLEYLAKSLLPNEKILYLSNRSKLKKQIKEDLIKSNGIDISDEELDMLDDINGIKIINYQKLEIMLKFGNFNFDNYKYIICDEIHYVISDSNFNSNSSLIFKYLIQTSHKNSIKVFMSATLGVMKDLIKLNSSNFKNIHEYKASKSYSYLDIKYYKKDKDLIQLVKNDNESEDKWLIFVTSISNGNKLLEEFKSLNIDAVFMNSKSKNDYISDGCFDSKVLISTSLLDNGVSLKCESIKNIVVNAFDYTTFKQMLGRIRVDNDRVVNLFINKSSPQSFHTILHKYIKPKMSQVELYKSNLELFNKTYSDKYNELHTSIFKLSDGKWELNNIGLYKLIEDDSFVKKAMSGFKKDEYWFIKEQLRWIGMEETFNMDNMIENVIDDNEKIGLKSYLDSLLGKKLFSDEQQELSDYILNELITLDKSKHKRASKLKPSVMESIIRNQLGLDYSISKTKTEGKGEMRGKRYVVVNSFEM